MEADGGFTAEELVQACNRVLVFAGLVARVANVEEVRVVCSSTGLFVAALEAFLRRRLDAFLRAPATPAERAYNNEKVVEVLSLVLSCDVSHISGARIVEGCIEDISNLLELLAALCQDKPLLNPPSGEQDPHPGASVGAEPRWSSDGEGRDSGGSADEADEDSHDVEGAEEEEDGSGGYSEEDGEDGYSEEDDGDDEGDAAADGIAGPPGRWAERSATAARAADAELHSNQPPGQLSQASQPARSGARVARQVAVGAQAALSPIPELSLECRPGWTSAPAGTGLRGPSRAAFPRHSSGGGASSSISIPSHVQEGREQCGELPADPRHVQQGGPGQAHRSRRSGSSTGTLLEQALSHADAALLDLGREYEGFYYDDDPGQGHPVRGSSRPKLRRQGQRKAAASSSGAGGTGPAKGQKAAALRNLKAAAWPDGEHGNNTQQRAFLRRAQRALKGEASAGSSKRPSARPSSCQRTGPAVRSRKGVAGGAGDARLGRKGEAHADLTSSPVLHALFPGTTTQPGSSKHSRNLLQRTAAAYSVSLPASPARGGPGSGDAFAGGLCTGSSKQGMQLNANLEGKLRYVYGLATEQPKQQAARSAVQQLSVQEEALRHMRRRELVERLGEARARRDAALRLTSHKLREQSQEHEKRVEQLKLQRLASEWSAKRRSAQMRRALQAELALREVFMEVLEGEKEVLLAARRDARAAAKFPQYKSTMRKAEAQYMQLFNAMEDYLASERQQRVRAHQEALQAQRHSNGLAASVLADRMQEVLGRVAQREEALHARNSITTRPESRQALVAQMRRLLGLH